VKTTAIAHANIALVKYWGKRDYRLILPQAASLSVALDKLVTETTVELGVSRDTLEIDGQPADFSRARVMLDAAGIRENARIVSRNSFPTAAGLASSASGFAALAAAIGKGSEIARLGSGSAARSVPGGWAVWEDESARQVFPPSHWDLRFCIAVCDSGPKETSSRDGMRLSRETSPYHPAWIEQCRRDLPRALQFLAQKDLAGLGALAESNALRMHADALASDPPLLYWQPATVGCLHALHALRNEGVQAWATIDAGPHLVAICAPGSVKQVETRLRAVSGVVDVLVCSPAEGARVVP